MGFYEFMNEVVLAFVEGIVILLLFLIFADKKDFIVYHKARLSIFIIWYALSSYWATMFLPPEIHTVCITVFIIASIGFITKSNIFLTITTVAIIGIIMSIIEVSVLVIEINLFKIDLNQLIATPGIKLLTNAIVKGVELVLVSLLFKSKLKLYKYGLFTKETSAISLVTIQIFTMTIFIISVNFGVVQRERSIAYNTILFILSIIFVFLGYFDYKEKVRSLKIQSKFQAQEEHVRHLETVIGFIRREKHDFANHLNTIHIMSKLGKPDSIAKIADYTTKLTYEIGSSYQFYNTGNDYIDGLLAVKSNVAHEMGITLQVDFEAPLSRIEIADSDLTSIVGNIVDNAFEAVSQEPEGKCKTVSISSYMEGDKYYLKIANNGPMIPEKVLQKIFESGFSTKTDNRDGHGYGLYIVKQMVERNGGEITVESTAEETVFEVRFNIN